MSILEAATAALRETPAADGARDATRARLARSLEGRARRHQHVVALVTVLVLMLGATASWAWSTGRLQGLFASGAIPRDEAALPVVEKPRAKPRPEAPPVERARPEPETWSAPADVAIPPVAKRAPTARPVRPAEVLYRRAHELHFRGTDREAALAAWDAYLAAESTGTFAVEARFNRGIVLVRLARYTEAITALEPFARGDVANGYRREEAADLVARLRALVVQP